MHKKTMEDLERSIIISNKILSGRIEKLEDSIEKVIKVLTSNNTLLTKVIEENHDLQSQVLQLKEFAKKVIETNKAASDIMKFHQKGNEEINT